LPVAIGASSGRFVEKLEVNEEPSVVFLGQWHGGVTDFPAFKTKKRLDNPVAQPVNGRYRSIAGNKKSTSLLPGVDHENPNRSRRPDKRIGSGLISNRFLFEVSTQGCWCAEGELFAVQLDLALRKLRAYIIKMGPLEPKQTGKKEKGEILLRERGRQPI
jgi:hypothetical protein